MGLLGQHPDDDPRNQWREDQNRERPSNGGHVQALQKTLRRVCAASGETQATSKQAERQTQMNANFNRMKSIPVDVPRTMRPHTARGLTSLPAGKAVPIFAAGLHREDAIASGRIRCSFELEETVEVLMNAVRVDVRAYVVPFLAFTRFNGSMDILDRSYKGEPPMAGETVIPYVEQIAGPAYMSNDILTYLGLHYKTGTMINTAYIEAYNLIFNHRAKNRSPKLFEAVERTRLQANLAPAFWNHERFKHVVHDFDDAKVDGEVALNVTSARMPVEGIYLTGGVAGDSNAAARNTKGQTVNVTKAMATERSGRVLIQADAATQLIPQVFVEMQQNGITVSLANIELAKKTQAFAKLREAYAGHHEEFVVNLLMDGIRVADQEWKEPILVASASTIFGMSKRYATDAANLTESVVNGATFVDLNIQTPRVLPGGVLMIIAEITPEQMFERQKDAFLHMSNNEADRPKFIRDYMDPQKVRTVINSDIDVNHATGAATFGYAPLNSQWVHDAPHIGGRFYRPQVNAGFDEDRQRLWAVETENPTLGPDFYLCTNIHTKPFAVTNQDIAEVVLQGDLVINGNTQFGPALIEASNDYAKVLDQVDQARIVKP
nr:MAG: major capsid protein [Microvirus sp.]